MRRLIVLAGLASVFVCLFAATAAAEVYPPISQAPRPAPAPPGSVPASRGALPFTGSDIQLFVLIGLCAAVLGLVLIVTARRRARVLSKV
jgi:LPXTG-motif cell wall-anchored protein